MSRWQELRERLAFALAILRDRDSALTAHVRREIGAIDSSVELHAANMARAFSLEGYSGGSAPIMLSWLGRALAWEPVAPLTGADDEWVDVAEIAGRTLWQNRRCGRVFKEGDGTAYDIQGRVFREPSGACFTRQPDSRTSVVFPYRPVTVYVDVPADEVTR